MGLKKGKKKKNNNNINVLNRHRGHLHSAAYTNVRSTRFYLLQMVFLVGLNSTKYS